MKRLLLIKSFILLTGYLLNAQVDAKMFRYPDVSEDQIVFSYGNDIWVCSKAGGTAVKLSSPDGEERFARFSPDGSQIAYSANYDGNTDLYIIPSAGGIPQRLTYHGMSDRVLDWHPDGKAVLFHSNRKSGRQRFGQFYKISVEGGLAEQLPVPYGEFASYSPDGKQVVYTDKSRAFRTWKRYRGGTAADIRTFDLSTMESKTLAASDANDEIPMWHDDMIYFISDRGTNKRFNIWSYNTKNQQLKQVTKFKDFDIRFPAIGPKDLVFEAGGKIYLMNLASQKLTEVKIDVFTDQEQLKPRMQKVGQFLSHASVSPDGKRVVVEARGELFSLPAEKGFIRNLSNSSGTAERYPSWSPSGRYIAYWSDKEGEYNLYLKDMKEGGTDKRLTNFNSGYKYEPQWSPDSKKLAYIDETGTIWVLNVEEESFERVDQSPTFMSHGALNSFLVNWSADSKWMAYNRSVNTNNAIFLYDLENKELHQVTSGYYNDYNPVFDPEGKYLYYLTNRHFSPVYSDVDGTWVYPNATQVAAASLRADVPSPLEPTNDEVTIEEDEEKEQENGEEKDGEEEDGEEEESGLVIDLADLESRAVLLPMDPGNFGGIAAVKGKLIFHRAPNSGSGERQAPLKYWDFKAEEEKTIMGSVYNFVVAARGKKLMVFASGGLAVVDIAPGQKADKKVPVSDIEMMIDPKAEHEQIFEDAWRLQRDFFYDPNMHGVDWEAQKEQYGALVKDATTRSDMNYILGELIGELNASHTYNRSGDSQEDPERRNVGYLGVDFGQKNGKYFIKKIIRGAKWDIDTRSPLDQPGVEVNEGDYILAVNGQELDINKEPYAAFQGLAGKTVELTINSTENAAERRKVIVKAMGSETRLRHLAWIEGNRQRVEEASNGRIGYVYVRSTGIDGQNELVRQYQAQWNKEGLIVDERFNSGGQIPDRFVELLNRPALAFWDVRHGKSWQHPSNGHFGKKVMLINGWSGSGGDAFPDYFRKSGLGPLIGTRTWGGLIGISGAPSLIDGGSVTVPTFRMYDPNGDWFREGYGVEPDIEVPENPTQLAKGVDPQLERAIQEIMKDLPTQPKDQIPDAPKVEKRSE